MPHALFCVAEEAIPLVRKLMKSESAKLLRFVVSRSCTGEDDALQTELGDDKPIHTDFIGASKEECRRWALDIGSQLNIIDQSVILIADTRSAEDGTLSLQHYPHTKERTTYEKFGPLPPVLHTWYEFRIDNQDCLTAIIQLTFQDIGLVEPAYFGLKDELVDERGVFNVAEVQALLHGKDPERLGSVVNWDDLGPSL